MNANKLHFLFMPSLSISPKLVLDQALQTGFCKRIGKIHPCSFWEVYCVESVHGTLSHNDLAARLEAQGCAAVSRQAVSTKASEAGCRFFENVLAAAMASQIDAPVQAPHLQPFKRIIVQDSTVIRLPAKLFELFSGVKNAHTSVCNARIQGVYDVLAGRFLHYSIDPYSRNDMAAALDFTAQPGDLVLKDRGYLKVEGIQKDIEQQADSIFRYKHPTSFHDARTGKKLVIADLLKKWGAIDMEVIMGPESGDQVPVRLVAFPVPDEVANLRRRKAKKESNGKNPSKELLFLMGWSIFITTLAKSRISPRQIAALYAVRWRIENYFKTWKSNFCFDHIHNASEMQVRMLLIARLTMIVLLHHEVFTPLAIALAQRGRELSIMKFMRYAQMNLSELLDQPSKERRITNLIEPMLRYGVLDRRKRNSLDANLALVLAEISSTA